MQNCGTLKSFVSLLRLSNCRYELLFFHEYHEAYIDIYQKKIHIDYNFLLLIS